MPWPLVLSFVASLVISYALLPKPETAPSPSVDQVKAPTAKVGGQIAVLFGTRRMDGPNTVWYGDIRITPIKKKGGKK